MNYCLRCNKELKAGEAHYGQHVTCFQEIFRVTEKTEFSSLIRKSSTSDAYNIGCSEKQLYVSLRGGVADEAIQLNQLVTLDCFASLAMTN